MLHSIGNYTCLIKYIVLLALAGRLKTFLEIASGDLHPPDHPAG